MDHVALHKLVRATLTTSLPMSNAFFSNPTPATDNGGCGQGSRMGFESYSVGTKAIDFSHVCRLEFARIRWRSDGERRTN
jgi:hypothetical protein